MKLKNNEKRILKLLIKDEILRQEDNLETIDDIEKKTGKKSNDTEKQYYKNNILILNQLYQKIAKGD